MISLVVKDMTLRMATALVLSISLHLVSSIAVADRFEYNDIFTKADSAQMVLVVRGNGPDLVVIERVLKGSLVPRAKRGNGYRGLRKGVRYLLFLGARGARFEYSSPTILSGERGARWVRVVDDWIHTTEESARNDILTRSTLAELAHPPVHESEWAMALDVYNTNMHQSGPRIEKDLGARLNTLIGSKKMCVAAPSFDWFAHTKRASVVRIRAGSNKQARILENIAGRRIAMQTLNTSRYHLSAGVEYLMVVDEQGSSLDQPLRIASDDDERFVAFVRKWRKQGMKRSVLRAFAHDAILRSTSVCQNEIQRLAYDAVRELIRGPLTSKDCGRLTHNLHWAPALEGSVQGTCKAVQRRSRLRRIRRRRAR